MKDDPGNYFEKPAEDSFPDLTPLIDVVFMLIIFFLLTSTLTEERILSINLPGVSTAEAPQTENVIIIEINDESNIFFQSAKTDFIQIEFKLRDIATTSRGHLPAIIIRSDKKSNFGTVLQLMDIIQNSGYDAISFAVAENQS
ncbi:MAG: biopolymer transporter ExbD [Spirochaetes bacterium]|nr:biopolymer transporter ExbD [Spirochaetota bacterium]